MLPHAPGVQMQAIPEDAVHEDSGDEDGEDPDKRISSMKYLFMIEHVDHYFGFNCSEPKL